MAYIVGSFHTGTPYPCLNEKRGMDGRDKRNEAKQEILSRKGKRGGMTA